ncbi:methyl-accepting chemotaxis protein [Alkalicoccus urumqiensis]|nr:methyl-accepting chemotaxis protein [Alkalicoccus urumqiensis]
MRHSMKGKFVLFAGGLVVATMLVTSLVIYWQLSAGIEQSVNDNAEATVVDAERYIQEYMEKYSMTVEGLASDSRVQTYLEGGADADASWEAVSATHETYEARDEGIQLMYVGSSDGTFLSTPVIEVPDDFDATARPWYEEAEAAPEEVIWTSPYIDVETEELVITTAKAVQSGGETLGVKAVDLSLNDMAAALEQTDIGYNGELSLVDENGIFIAHTNPERIGEGLPEGSQLETAVAGDSAGSVTSNEETAYFQEIDGFGWTVLTEYENSELYAELATTRNTFIIAGLAAVLLAVLAAYAAGTRFTKPIAEMKTHVQRLADGDLTASVNVRSRDEVGELGHAVNHMTEELHGLITSIQQSVGEAREMAEDLSAVSEETVATSDDMSTAVTGVAEGAARQAEDIEKTGGHMQSLSGRVEEAGQRADEMSRLSDTIREANDAGSASMKALSTEAEETAAVFTQVQDAVQQLTGRVAEIGTVVQTISEFADQTNLLALNASIEAARAGEHGRGFAVVADEVRRLAEQSLKATETIRGTLKHVEQETDAVSRAAQHAGERQEAQQGAVKETESSLASIITSVNSLRSVIDGLYADLKSVTAGKDSMEEAMTSIAEVSENAAATAEQVSASAAEQVTAVEQVGRTSEKLNDLSAALQQKTSRFTV